jgi:hypothetical protein
MVFDGLTNDNEIAWNLNYHQYISRRIEGHIYNFFIFLYLFKDPLSRLSR